MGIRWKRSKQTYGPKKPGRIRRWITYWRNHWRDLIGAYFIQQAYDFIAYRSYPAIINIYVSGILMIALFVLMFGQIQKDTSSPGFMTWMKNWNMDTLIILYVAFLLAGLVAVILSASALFWYYNRLRYRRKIWNIRKSMILIKRTGSGSMVWYWACFWWACGRYPAF